MAHCGAVLPDRTTPLLSQDELVRDSMPFPINRDEVVFLREMNGESSIWIMYSDGSNKRELINELNGEEIALIRPLDSEANMSELTYLFAPHGLDKCILRTVQYPAIGVHVEEEHEVNCETVWYLPDEPTHSLIDRSGDSRTRNALREPFDGAMYNYADGAGSGSLIGTCVSPQNEMPHYCRYEGMKYFIVESDLVGQNFRLGFNADRQTGYFYDWDGHIYWTDPEGEIPTIDLTTNDG